MLITKISNDLSNRLYMQLDANIKSLRKRNISYIIVAHSDTIATINLYVTGKKGTASKDLVIIFDKDLAIWTAYSQGNKYDLNSIGEVNLICKNILNLLGVTVTKF